MGITTLTFEAKFRECVDIVGNPADVTSTHQLFWLRVFFGRMRSRWAGSLAETFLPVSLRAPIYRGFAGFYGSNLDEVRYPLDSFKSFADFFCRPLRDGSRPIADVPRGLVSPVDGRVLTSGVVEGERARVPQVKGATYSMPVFLGVDPALSTKTFGSIRYVVLYLAPGDYHRIHAPARFTINQGRHFTGELIALRDSLLSRFNDIFTVNERVVLSGQWEGGQMHLVAVAAQNVGNIYLAFDKRLKTNRERDICVYCGGDISSVLFDKGHGGVELAPGQEVGGFRLGSTVVLVFDAPETFEWRVQPGDRVRVGEPIGQAS